MRVAPDDDDEDVQTVCWPGQLFSGILFAVMFGGLGFVLAGGHDRSVLSVIGQVGGHLRGCALA